MRYEDASQSGSFQDQGPAARDDADQLAAGDRGPATGNVITGAGTETGASGADNAAGAKVTALAGAGGSDNSFSSGQLRVEGEHGTLSLSARGDYSYTAKAGVPENSRDIFTYTLSDAAGATSQARLMIEIGKTQAVVDANARRVVPGPDGVVTLPAGVELSDIRIVGRDLLIMLPDGTQMLIVDGAVFVPQLVINDIEVPSTNLAALLIEQEPRPASGVPQSSGGNFITPVGPLDPGTPLGDLLPPTQLQYTPPEFRDVFDIVDLEPEVGANPLIQLDDDARPGGNAGGTGDDADGVNVSGTLSGSGGDGPLTFALSTTGAPTGFTYVSGPNGSLLVQQGGVTVLTVTVNAQTGAYSVVQNAPVLHSAGENENNSLFTFNYTVTDRDGDSASGTFQVNVDDDSPIIDVTAGADAGILLTTDDADSRGESSDSASSSAGFGGVFGLTQSIGADGAGTAGVLAYALGTPGGASGLTQGGAAINLYLVGGKVVGSTATSAAGVTGANTVFDVSVSGTGVVTLTQYSQIDHTNTDPSATAAPFNDQLISLADGLVTLTATASTTDRDGDSASDSATVQIGANLRFSDDGPSLGELRTGSGVTLDETSAGSPAGFPISATSQSAVIAGSALTFGADGPAASGSTSYGITIVGGGATSLQTAQGNFPITLVQTSANVITGTYDGGKTAFTVTINANGTLTVQQSVPLEHLVDGSTAAAFDDSLDLSGLINATVTVRDFDGDTASGSAPIGNLIIFKDDGPDSSLEVEAARDVLVLDETQPVGSDTGGASDPAGLATVTANFADNFATASFGGDGAGSIAYSLVLSGGNVGSGLYTLQVGDTGTGDNDPIGRGAEILLNQSGNTITGSANGVDYFTISIDPATGIVTFTQLQPIWNPTGGSSHDEAAYLAVAEGSLVVRQTVTDSDGDSDSSEIDVSEGVFAIQDDGPLARNDADALAAGAYGPETGNVVTGAGTTGGSSGADTLGRDGATVVAVSAGEASDSSFDANGNLVLGGQYGVLTIKADGSYSYVRNAGTPGGVTDTFTYTLRDTDGDTSNAQLVISIGNTPPTVNAPDAGAPGTIVYEAALGTRPGEPEGSGEQAAPGADGDPRETVSGTITFNQGDGPATITIAGVVVTGDGQVIDTGEGLLTISAVGAGSIDYTYTLKDNLLVTGTSSPDSFEIVVTDQDGQSATDTLTITIVDDAPDARDDTDALAAGTYGPESGNVITGSGTTSGSGGADVTGADNAAVVAVAGFNGSADSTFDANGNLVVNGQYGVLTIKADGSYSYVRNAGTPGGVSDVFTYTLQDGDGDQDTATLTISVGNTPPTVNAPDAGAPGTIVYEAGLPGRNGEPEGSGEEAAAGADGDPREATSGVISFNQGDGPATVTIAGATVTTTGQVIDTGEGLLTITSIGAGSIGYTYVLKDNLLVSGASSPDSFDVVVTDQDGQSATDTLTITIVDDAPDARNDSDALAAGTYGPETGNVISGAGTTSGAPGADTVGADNSSVVAVAGFNGSSDNSFDGNGNLVVNGQYGVLTIKADGSYSYARNAGTPGGVSDVFTYTLQDSDGDQDTATLTIGIGNTPPTINAPDLGADGTIVYEAALSGSRGAGESEGSGEEAATGSNGDTRETTTGAISFTQGDGPSIVTIAGVTVTTTGQVIDTGEGLLTVTSIGAGSIGYSYTLKDNLLVSGTSSPDSFLVTITDQDGQTASDTLTITIVDDAPDAINDVDSVANGNAPATGNVISGVDVAGGDANATDGVRDVQGADGARVSQIASVNAPANVDATADGSGNFMVNGQYGTLTINQDGSYSYVRFDGAPLTATETFIYTLRDGDGDTDVATLTIGIDDEGVTTTIPAAGGATTTVYEAALGVRPTEPEGSGEAAAPGANGDPREAVSGTIAFTAPDGLGSLSLGGSTLSGTYPQTVATNATGTLVVTGVSYDAGTGLGSISYTYTLADNTIGAVPPASGDTSQSFALVVTDVDGDTSGGNLVISIIDDVPTARNDVDSVGNFNGPETGNVISGIGTLSGAAGADTTGADNAIVVALGSVNVPQPFDITPTNGEYQINGQYGTLTIHQNGNYSYTRFNGAPLTGSDVFTYVLRDGDGDLSNATLTINIADNPVTTEIPAAGSATTIVYEAALAARSGEFEGSGEAAAAGADGDTRESVTGVINVTAPDGVETVSIAGTVLTGSVGQVLFQDATGKLVVTGIVYDEATGVGAITYTYTLLDNTVGAAPPATGNTTQTFAVVVTDEDGDTSGGNLVITIVDDVPTAANDVDSVANSNNPATGNVITGVDVAGGDANATDGSADVPGADSASVVRIASNNVPANSDTSFDGSGNLVVTGQYGVLTIKADGSYSYARSTGAPLTASDVFTYTLRDADGDEATATLTIGIDDKPVTTTIPVAGGATTTVYEAGLPSRPGEAEGSGEAAAAGADGDPRESVSGSIAFTAPDGIGSLSLGGVTLSGSYPQTITTAGGQTLVVTGVSYNAGTGLGSISYTYTLTDNTLGVQAVNGGDTNASFALVVTDSDGDTSGGNLVIKIVDDAPAAANDVDSVGNSNNPATGNVITGVDVAGGDANATDGSADVPGADSASVVRIASNNVPANSDTSFDGSGNLVVTGQHGVLTIKADGSYSYARSNGAPLTATDVFTYTLRDGDGDEATATLTIGIDDKPVTTTIPVAGGATTTVYEKGLPVRPGEQAGSGEIADGIGNNNSDASEAVSGSIGFTAPDGIGSLSLAGTLLTFSFPQTVSDNATGTLVVTGVSYNAVTGIGAISYTYTLKDNTSGDATNATFALVVTDSDGDTSGGNLVISIVDDTPDAINDADSIASGSNLAATGNVITGVDGAFTDANATDGVRDVQGADGASVVRIASNGVPANVDTTFDGSGNLVVAGLYGTLTIKADGSYSYTRASGSPGDVTDVFTYTLRDGDGDEDTATLTIDIGDAAPVVGPNLTVLLDDDAKAGGIAGGTGDVDPDTANLSGTLSGSGGDGALTWALQLTGAPSGFSYVSNGAGGILIQQGGTTYVTVTLNATTGAYTVTQNLPLPHATGADENTQPFTLGYTVSDADGDSASGTLRIELNDDTPTATASIGSDAAVFVTTFDANTIAGASDVAQSTANFGSVFSFVTAAGADGSSGGAAISFGLSLTGATNVSNLTQGGQPIYLYNIGGVIVGSTSATQPASATAASVVFSIAVTNGGVVTLTQYSQIDHTNLDPTATGTPFNDHLISLANGFVRLTGSVTITDNDGDTATSSQFVDLGGNIRFGDDGPAAVNDTISQLTENSSVTFGVFGNDSFGADGVNINDAAKVTHTQPPAGQGTVSYNAVTGEFTFVPASGQAGSTSFTYTITDRDGDTSTATVTINLQPDSVPQVNNAVAAVDDEGLSGGNAGGSGDIDANSGEVPLSASEATYNGKINVNFGGDSAGAMISFANLHGTSVTIGQETVNLTWNAGSSTLIGAGPRGNLFQVVVNQATGDYTVTLLDNVLHTQGDNVETSVSIDLFYRAADSDGDVDTSGKLTVTFNDDLPVFGTVTSPLVIANSGTVSGTGDFQINLGGDGAPASNDVVKTLTLNSVEINGIAATNVVLTPGVENATTASYTISFDYQTAPGVTTTQTGTLVIDKVSGEYTVDFANPVQSFSIESVQTGAAPIFYDVDVNGDGDNTDAADNNIVAVVGTSSDFFIQFTGRSSVTGSSGTFGLDEQFVGGTREEVKISSTAIGVKGNSVQPADVLDYNFYSTNPGAIAGNPPTSSASTAFIQITQFNGSEDFILVLKLADPATPGTFITRTVVVNANDVITTNVSGYPTLSNGDGLIIVEPNDYLNLAGVPAGYEIVGMQLRSSSNGLGSEAGEIFNFAGALNSFDNTTTSFNAQTNDNEVFKILDIGVVRTSTTNQSAVLDFTAVIQDADGDTATTGFEVVIGTPPAAASSSSTSSAMLMSSNDNDGGNLRTASNSNNLALMAGLAAGFASTSSGGSTGNSGAFALQSDEVAFGDSDALWMLSALDNGMDLSSEAIRADYELAGGAQIELGNEPSQSFIADQQLVFDPSASGDQFADYYAAGGDQGTDLPVAALAPIPGAGEIHIPSGAELVAFLDADGGSGLGPVQGNAIVESVLADALSGGGDRGFSIDQLVDAAAKIGEPVQHQGGSEAVAVADGGSSDGGILELATQLHGHVPGWDAGHFSPLFQGAGAAMDNPALHPDAVQPAVNG